VSGQISTSSGMLSPKKKVVKKKTPAKKKVAKKKKKQIIVLLSDMKKPSRIISAEGFFNLKDLYAGNY
jgi:hypothetical protein